MPTVLRPDPSRGATVLEAARAAGLALDDDCGRLCACTACGVLLLEGAEKVSPMRDDEREILAALWEGEVPKALRLACQARLFGEVVIEVADGAPRR
jgi:ferredoxin